MKRIRLKVHGNGTNAKIKAVEIDSQHKELPQRGGNLTTNAKEQVRWIFHDKDMTDVDFVVRFFDVNANDWDWPFVETPTAENNGLLVPRPFGNSITVTLRDNINPDWKYWVWLNPENGIEPLDPMIIIRGGKQSFQLAAAAFGGALAGAVIATCVIWLFNAI